MHWNIGFELFSKYKQYWYYIEWHQCWSWKNINKNEYKSMLHTMYKQILKVKQIEYIYFKVLIVNGIE